MVTLEFCIKLESKLMFLNFDKKNTKAPNNFIIFSLDVAREATP